MASETVEINSRSIKKIYNPRREYIDKITKETVKHPKEQMQDLLNKGLIVLETSKYNYTRSDRNEQLQGVSLRNKPYIQLASYNRRTQVDKSWHNPYQDIYPKPVWINSKTGERVLDKKAAQQNGIRVIQYDSWVRRERGRSYKHKKSFLPEN